jgi:hypothetical protein
MLEIHHHAVVRVAGLLHGLAPQRDLQLVGMAVDVAAVAVVAQERMGHFEGEGFGDTDGTVRLHFVLDFEGKTSGRFQTLSDVLASLISGQIKRFGHT